MYVGKRIDIEKTKNMKKKIVLWGTNEKDEKILIALELKPNENQVNVYSFPEEKVTEVFFNEMMDNWRTGKEVEFPEGYETIVRELSVTEDILPESIKVQRGDLINRAKAEWHFVVLSTKLYDLYKTELEDLKGRVEKLIDFDKDIWEEVKGFWGKVVDQSRERNLFRDHSEKLKNETNNLFTTLKEFKTKANEELSKLSKEHVASFTTRLDAVKTKVTEGKSLSPLFDELKKIQNEFKGAEFTRNDRNKVWKRIDEAFKVVKEKKYGKPQEGGAQGAVSRVERRHQGLKSAIGKMQASINRDKRDIEFQNKRVNDTNGQLEMQIRQAKVKMIEERINSKQEKLDEMLATQVDLEKKIEKEKERAVKREEKKEIEKKKAEVKQKIEAEIKENQPEVSDEEAEKLKAAAADINAPKKKKKKAPAKAKEATADNALAATEEVKAEPESIFSAAAAVIGDAVEDVVDSVKAVGAVIADKVEDKVEDAKEDIAEVKEEIKDAKDSDTGETLMKGGILGAAVAAGAAFVKEATEKMEDLSEKVGLDDAVEKVKDTMSDAKDAVVDKVGEVKEDAKGLADKVEEKKKQNDEVESKAGETLMKGGLLATAVAAGSKLVQDASGKLEGLSEKMGLDETIEKAKATLEETKEAIGAKAAEAKETVTESVDEVADRVRKETAEAAGSSEEE